MSEFFLVKTDKGYFPAHDQDVEKSKKVKLGDVVKSNHKKGRNPGNHRRYFALLRTILRNTAKPDGDPMFKSTTEILDYMKFQTGHIEMQTIDGKVMFKPKSISFDEMPEDEFRKYFSKSIDIALQKVIDIDRNELMNQIMNFS